MSVRVLHDSGESPAGPALAVHLRPVRVYPVAGLTSLVSPLSKVRAS